MGKNWNGWIFHFTQYSALWTVPGSTAYRITVGWNIEIVFMFVISRVIHVNSISDDKNENISGLFFLLNI